MLNYQPAFSSRVPSPTHGLQAGFLGQVPFRDQSASLITPHPIRKELGRAPMGQTFEQIMGWPGWTGDLLRLTFHSGTAFLGVHVGLRSKEGFIKYLSWVLGIGNGLAAVADVISLAKRAFGTHPPEPASDKSPVNIPEPVPILPSAVVPGTRSF